MNKANNNILDAEGDGVAVAAWQFQGRDGTWHEFMNEKHRLATEADGTWPIRALYTHPARSGVVSDEDVEISFKVMDDTFTEDFPDRQGRMSDADIALAKRGIRAALDSYERNRK